MSKIELPLPWTLETMDMINKMTPKITGKSFDPDWFLLRQRFEQYEKSTLDAVAQRDEAIRAFRHLLDVCSTEPEPSLALESVTADSMHILTKLESTQ